MTRLNPTDLQHLYPDMSPEFSARMGRLLRALPSGHQGVRPRLPLRLALALVAAALLLSGTALALTRPAVLAWLLGVWGSGSPQLEQTAQEITASATAEGVTIRITGAVYDGSQLAISYESENAAPNLPVIVALDSHITVNGTSHELPHPACTYNTRMVPSPHLDVLPAQRNPVAGGFRSSTLPPELHGKVPCSVTFTVYRPEIAFAVLIGPDDVLRDTTVADAAFRAEIADALATLESFRNARIFSAMADIPAGYTPVDSSGRLINAPENANLTQVARITVPFSFDAGKAFAHDFSGTQADFADFTVHTVSFRLTPLQTYLDVRLLPRENTQAAALALSERCGAWSLTDALGQPVTYSDLDYCTSLLPYVTCMDGQWVCRYLIDMPGLQAFPASVGFTVQTGELLRFPLGT